MFGLNSLIRSVRCPESVDPCRSTENRSCRTSSELIGGRKNHEHVELIRHRPCHVVFAQQHKLDRICALRPNKHDSVPQLRRCTIVVAQPVAGLVGLIDLAIELSCEKEPQLAGVACASVLSQIALIASFRASTKSLFCTQTANGYSLRPTSAQTRLHFTLEPIPMS